MKMKLRATATLVASLGLLVALPARVTAQAGVAPALSGTVTDSSNAVIVGASVTLRNERATTRSAATDARGRYRFEKVPEGSYSLVVFEDGFSPVTREVRVGAEPQTVDVTLSPASLSEEVTVAFTGEHAQTALKMDVDVRDIPLTVKSYTNSFIKAVDVKQVADLYTYMTGVNRSGGGAYDTTVRGFVAGEPNGFQINGMPGLPARQNSQNVANVERIEVLKGPAAILYGRVEPGGLVNVITKRPQAVRQNALDLRFGSFMGSGPGFGDANSFRVAGDFTGPFDRDNKVLYRFVASYDNGNSFRDFVENEDIYVVPSLTWNISSGTFLTLEAEYRKLDNSLDQGLAAPQNDINFVADITTRYQEPGDFENEDGWSISAYFTKQFGSDVHWNATWRSVFHEDDRMGFENNRAEPDNRRIRRRDRHQVNKREYHYLDTYVTKLAQTGNVGHTLMLGVDGGYELRDFNRLRFRTVGLFVDVYDPVYGQPLPADPNPETHRIFDLYDIGGYVQDRIEFSPRWKGLLALRYDRQDTNQKELRLGVPPAEAVWTALLPMAGLVFQPDERWAIYSSYSTSFNPQSVTAVDEQGRSEFDPERGWQVEGGVKATLADGKVDATLAGYHIVKQNVLVPVGSGASDQIGEQRSRGFEVDLRTQPVRNWQLLLGYAFTDAEVTEDTRADQVGAELLNTPRSAFNLWTRYDVDSGALKGLGFGLGLIYRDERPGSFPSPVVQGGGIERPGEPVAQERLTLPSYFRADAGVYYVKDRYELTLRVNNLFDELYYESAFNLVLITPGNPREATLSLRFRF